MSQPGVGFHFYLFFKNSIKNNKWSLGEEGGGSGVSVSLTLHGSLHLLHHPQRNWEWLQLVHPDIWTVPAGTTHSCYRRNHRQTPCGAGYYGDGVPSDSLVFITARQILDVLFNQQVGLNTHKLQWCVQVQQSVGKFCVLCSVIRPHHLPPCRSHVVSLCQPLLIFRICRILKHTHTLFKDTHRYTQCFVFLFFYLKQIGVFDVDASSGSAHPQRPAVTSQHTMTSCSTDHMSTPLQDLTFKLCYKHVFTCCWHDPFTMLAWFLLTCWLWSREQTCCFHSVWMVPTETQTDLGSSAGTPVTCETSGECWPTSSDNRVCPQKRDGTFNF